MYCIRCGVELEESQTKCPLCQTKVVHPDFLPPTGEPLYPKGKMPAAPGKRWGIPVSLTVAFVLPLLVVLLCDLQFTGSVSWSAFVMGALVTGYILLALPTWFSAPNPVIFAPCDFVAIGLYLWLVNQITGGNWFLSFAFPVVGIIGALVTAVITLLRYLRGGKLFIFGGATVALGGFMLLMECLLNLTFQTRFIGWSLYPMVALILLGGFLLFLGICPRARESMERKFFI